MAEDDQELRAALCGADVAAMDGMPLVWLARRSGLVADRVYGPDFMRALLGCRDLAGDRPARHFLYGATDMLLERLTAVVSVNYPHAEIVGTLAPPFRPLEKEEEEEHCRQINAVRPDVVWVGLGAPRQELWMARNRSRLSAALLVGTGAAFDFLAETKPQAPRWLQRSGLEWAFRLACEPIRLGPRYLQVVPRFLLLMARSMVCPRDR